jgi:hypothetical protein
LEPNGKTADSLITEALPLTVAVIVLKVAVGVTMGIVAVSVGRNTRQVVNTTSDGMGCGVESSDQIGTPSGEGCRHELNEILQYSRILVHYHPYRPL